MATIVGLFEAKTNLGQIVKRAAGGEDIVITKRGNPLVRLVPADAGPAGADLKDAFERFKKIRKKAVLNGPGLPKLGLKELTREGLR
ncbi:MAG: type II toxin-antitoxin system prevent-host-death family antitoxin [Verrucomicrobiaceae bacterium]|nr:MAG: type II toxin-antitoxin system prevent-host-death family antitoxin [Verrucomicrobiaceae bacterium]